MDNKTIIAPASAPGRGGISVIRMSGGDAKKITERMCGPLEGSGHLKRREIRSSDGSLLDLGMVVLFESPNSYTGEDVVEFHCHGNPTIVRMVVDEALSLGAVLAEPGEFTKMAFLNDKIDLTQAESVADLINAQTESAVVAANSSLSGEFSKEINTLIDGIVKARVLVEANIDFPEEDIDDKLLDSIGSDLNEYCKEINELVSQAEAGVRLREGYSVAIVGAPNAGKSSLLNYLAREEVAITSEIPGTTRDLVRASINLGEIVVEFIDTAGVRVNPENEIEEEGILRSKDVIKKSNLTLLVKDSTDQQNFDIEVGACVTIMNKCDLLSSYPEGDGNIYFSSVTGEGLEGLLNAIMVGLNIAGGAETVYISRKRHVQSLKKTGSLIEESVVSLKEGQALELVAENLRSAHFALGEIIRPMSSDELLGEIFSEFCIGK